MITLPGCLRNPGQPVSVVVSGTDLCDILKDQSHAPQGGDAGQSWEDGQHLEVPDEHQQDQEGQDGQHVDADVQDGGQRQAFPGLADVGGHVGFLHYLTQSIRRGCRLNIGYPLTFRFQRINRELYSTTCPKYYIGHTPSKKNYCCLSEILI